MKCRRPRRCRRNACRDGRRPISAWMQARAPRWPQLRYSNLLVHVTCDGESLSGGPARKLIFILLARRRNIARLVAENDRTPTVDHKLTRIKKALLIAPFLSLFVSILGGRPGGRRGGPAGVC